MGRSYSRIGPVDWPEEEGGISVVKKWYRSKTLWVNALAIAAIIAQAATGREVISVETQAGILAVVNLVLRVLTSEGLEL